MRFFALAILVFFLTVPSALAAPCTAGTQPNTEDGKFYNQGVECTPQPVDSGVMKTPGPQDSGIITNPNASKGSAPGPIITLINPLGSGTDLEKFLVNILDVVIRIGSIIVVLMLVFVGFKFVTAHGDPTKLKEAKDNLLWTIVGALILLGAQAIAIGVKETVKALSGG